LIDAAAFLSLAVGLAAARGRAARPRCQVGSHGGATVAGVASTTMSEPTVTETIRRLEPVGHDTFVDDLTPLPVTPGRWRVGLTGVRSVDGEPATQRLAGAEPSLANPIASYRRAV
jgi:hypothetical protein